MTKFKNMRMLSALLLVITMMLLPLSYVNAQSSSASSAKQTDENAILRAALQQALNKLEYYTNIQRAAEEAIQSQRKTIADGNALIAQGTVERDKMQLVIDNAERAIKLLQEQIIEYEKQKTIYQIKVNSLEDQLAIQKAKTSFWRKLAKYGTTVGIVVGVVAGVLITKKVN